MMPRQKRPRISPRSYIHPTAVVIGDVTIAENVFVGPLSVLRADEPGSFIVIGKGCNVQDGVIVHALAGTSVCVAQESSLSHGCLVHGPCRVGRHCFVGFRSVVFRANIGDYVFIKSAAVVEDVTIPSGRFVGAGRLRKITPHERAFALSVVRANLALLKKYRHA